MICQSTLSYAQAFLDYIGSDYGSCLYLYLNYKKYQCSSDDIASYIYRTSSCDAIAGILLQYYNCMHVYSKNSYLDSEEILGFIKGKNPDVLFMNLDLSNMLEQQLHMKYIMHKIPVVEKVELSQYTINNVHIASLEEISEIAKYLMADKTFRDSYSSPNLLAEQMKERTRDGYGCTFVMKENNQIVWTSSIVAQDEKIAVESLIWLHPDYRSIGMGKPALATVANMLIPQGKRVFAFPVESTVGINLALGYTLVAETVKWIRK